MDQEAKITIQFFDDFLTESDQKEISSQALPQFPVAFWNKKSQTMCAAFDDIITTVNLFINDDFWRQFLSGIAVVAVCKGINGVLLQLKRVLRGRKIHKIISCSVTEHSPTIGIKANNINIILPVDISDEKFQYCVDKAFESVKNSVQKIAAEETITYIDKNSGDAITYTINEYYWNVVAPRKEREEAGNKDETTI